MDIRLIVAISAGLIFSTTHNLFSAVDPLYQRFQFIEPHLGTLVDLTLYASSEAVANDAAQAAFARIKELNRIFSDYTSDSEASRLCITAGSGARVPVSDELFELLRQSEAISEATGGAFDVTIGPVAKLWRVARRQRRLPPQEPLDTARELVGWTNVQLQHESQTVQLLKRGMQLDFGGIAKGYIAQQTRDVLARCGISRCLVSIAGDICAGDSPPDSDGWKIGIAPLIDPNGPPTYFLRLENCSVSTSGDAFQFVQIDGIRYSHIVNPSSGLGLTYRSSVTVVASDGATADGFATAITVLGVEKGLRVVEPFKDVAALMVLNVEQGLSIHETRNFKEWLIP